MISSTFINKFSKKDIDSLYFYFYSLLSLFLIWDYSTLLNEEKYYHKFNPLPLLQIIPQDIFSITLFHVTLVTLIILCLINISSKRNILTIFLSLVTYTLIAISTESNFAPVLTERFFHAKTAPFIGILILLIESISKKSKPFYTIFTFHIILSFSYLGPTIERIKKYSGFEWYQIETLKSYFINSYFINDNSISLFLAQNDTLLFLGVILTFIIEFFFIITLVFPKLLRIFLPMLILFHILIESTLEVSYIYYFPVLYACFFNKTYIETIFTKELE